MTLARSRTSIADRRSAVAALGAGLAVAALVVAGVPATAGAAETPAPLVGAQSASTVAGEYLVVLKRGVSTAATTRAVRSAKAAGGTVEQQFTHALNGYTATLSADDLADVRQDPSVAYVEAVRTSAAGPRAIDPIGRASSSPQAASGSVRTLLAAQREPSWNLDRIDQRSAKLDNRYVYEAQGKGVTAYMVGDGMDPRHPDFHTPLISGVNVSGEGGGIDSCFGIGVATMDLAGGIDYGVAKWLPMIKSVKITRCRDGVSDTAGFIAAMDWIIADHQAGEPAVAEIEDWYQASPAVDAAVTALIADGVTAVAVSGQPAAGAASESACNFSPGRVPAVLTVGAVNAADQRDPRYSHSGKCVDLWAPGVNVEALYNGGNPGTVYEPYIWWGTWFAAPHVTGAVANYLELQRAATPDQVATAIHTATTRGVLTGIGASAPNELVYALPADAPPKTPDAHAITAGTALRRGDAITSPNGFYTLRTQTDGTVVLARAVGRVTWAPGVQVTWLQMSPNGSLRGYDFAKQVWTSHTFGGPSDLRVQDDGNVVVYRRSDNTATWASKTAGKLPPKQPTAGSDRLAAKQGLVRGGGVHLQSPNGRYRAFVHTDTGQLAVRDQTTGTYIFRTPALDSDWVGLQSDGNLVLVTRTGTALWASGTGGKGLSDLVMQDDGNLVIYLRSTGKATWSSKGGKV